MTIETKSDFYRVLSSAVTDAYIDKYGAETWYNMSDAEKQSIINKTINMMTRSVLDD